MKGFLGRKRLVMAVLAAVSVSVLLLSPVFGQYTIGPSEVYAVVIGHLTGNPVGGNADLAVWDIRVPNAITALVVGTALGICGAAMQGIMRNPLADPYTMGVSSGASLGASMFFVLGISVIPGLTGNLAMMLNAFLLSLVPTAIVIGISFFRRMTATSTILAGIAVMYVFSATTSLMMLIANPTQLSEVYMWNLGTVGKGDWDNLPLTAIPALVCSAVLMSMWSHIDILSSGDELSHTVGINPNKTRVLVMVVVSASIAAIVCFTGTIGFVGLVAPHIARVFVGSEMRYLLPTAAMTGGTLLIVANCIAKTLGGLPVGVITSLIGCPLFIILLIRQHRSAWC